MRTTTVTTATLHGLSEWLVRPWRSALMGSPVWPDFTERSATAFSGYHWPEDVVLMAVRWSLSHALSATRRGAARGAECGCIQTDGAALAPNVWSPPGRRGSYAPAATRDALVHG